MEIIKSFENFIATKNETSTTPDPIVPATETQDPPASTEPPVAAEPE